MGEFGNLLMVVENYQGIRERNMLFTKEEFFEFLEASCLGDLVDDIRFLLDSVKSGLDWRTLYSDGGSLEFRCCRDEKDLRSFLNGEYNDSPEKMVERGEAGSGRRMEFQWENAVEEFSPKARPFFERMVGAPLSLDEQIRNAANVGRAPGANVFYKDQRQGEANLR